MSVVTSILVRGAWIGLVKFKSSGVGFAAMKNFNETTFDSLAVRCVMCHDHNLDVPVPQLSLS